MTSSVDAAARTGPDGRVVITGGSGFVGRALVAAFLKRGTEVRVVDRFEHGEVPTVVGELTDPGVRDAALDGDVAGVVHLAAITSVLRSIDAPAETVRMNVEVTGRLLEACRTRGIDRFIMASTNAVVGDVGHARVDETAPLRPLTPYGATKAACEMLLSGYAGAFGLATCALRLTNVYGPGMGHKDSFVPRLMRAALAGGTVQVFGDGTQRRDLVHVFDVAQAVLRAWTSEVTGPVIVGSGRSTSVLDLVDAARTATGRPIGVEHVPAKRGEMPAVVVDIGRARDELGWAPSLSLDAGLGTVWDDFRRDAASGERR